MFLPRCLFSQLQDLMERRIRQRIELQDQHAQQMHFKQLKQTAEKEEEEQFRQQVGRECRTQFVLYLPFNFYQKSPSL